MNDVMRSLFGLVIRLSLLLAGLVFFAMLLAGGAVLLAVWVMRALWAKLTGQPVRPWVFQVFRQPPWARGRSPGSASTSAHSQTADDVIDAEVKVVSDPAPTAPKRLD